MKVAELFVNLGIKGANEANLALNSVKGGLKDIAFVATTATAAITGSIYAFKTLASQSNEAGNSLKQFENQTGLSGETLQRWQQLAIHAGVGADEMAQSIQSLQEIMAKTALGQGYPGGLAAMTNALTQAGVKIDPTKIRDTFYMLQKAREYLQLTRNIPDISNELARTLIPNGNIRGALRTSTFDLSKADPSRIYSERQLQKLSEMKAKWDELGESVNHSIGRLNVAFGPALLSDLTKLTTEVLKLVGAMAKLATATHVLDKAGQIAGFWATAIGTVTDALDPVKRKNIIPSGDVFKVALQGVLGAPPTQGANSPVVNVNTHVTVDGAGGNAAVLGAEIGRHVSKLVNDAFRQIPVAGQGKGSAR